MQNLLSLQLIITEPAHEVSSPWQVGHYLRYPLILYCLRLNHRLHIRYLDRFRTRHPPRYPVYHYKYMVRPKIYPVLGFPLGLSKGWTRQH